MFESILFTTLLSLGVVRGPVMPGENTAQMKIFAFYASSKSDPLLDDQNRGEAGAITGHCFLEFKNITSNPITIGHIQLYQNQSFTISRWPPINAWTGGTGGVWYNRESFDTAGWGTLESYSLTTTISDLDVENLTLLLHTGLYDGYYLLNGTCANFSVQIWNSFVSSTSLQLTESNLPSVVKTSIGTKTGFSINSSYVINTYYGYTSYGVYYSWTL